MQLTFSAWAKNRDDRTVGKKKKKKRKVKRTGFWCLTYWMAFGTTFTLFVIPKNTTILAHDVPGTLQNYFAGITSQGPSSHLALPATFCRGTIPCILLIRKFNLRTVKESIHHPTQLENSTNGKMSLRPFGFIASNWANNPYHCTDPQDFCDAQVNGR